MTHDKITADDINQKARAIVKEMDQDGDGHAQKAADMLRNEFASTSMTTDDKKQLLKAIRNGETQGAGADLVVSSASLDAIRANPKLQNELYVQLTTRDRTLGDAVTHPGSLIVAKTETGFKSFSTVSDLQNTAIHIAHRMDKGEIKVAEQELQWDAKNMKPEDFKAVLADVKKEIGTKATELSASVMKQFDPPVPPITDPVILRHMRAEGIARELDQGNNHLAAEDLRNAGRTMQPQDFQALLAEVRKLDKPNVGGDLLETRPYIEPIKSTDTFAEQDRKAELLKKPVVHTFEIFRTESETANEKKAYGGSTKSAQFEKIATKTDNLPAFTIIEGDPRLSY